MKLKNSTAEIFRKNDMIFTSEGNFRARQVQGDYGFRPNQPAAVQTRCKWIIGDVTEVLDRNTWKLGKILKMLKDNYFVIRLADCIQLKEFHISSLRIPHALGVPAADKEATRRGKRQPADHGALPRSKAVQQTGRQTHEQETNGKKRKAAVDASRHWSKRAHPRNVVAAASTLNGAMADSYLHSPSQVRHEAECSVASCSVNDPDHFYADGDGKRRAAGGLASCCFPDDAMSTCPCTPGMDEAAAAAVAGVDVHGLELEAYRSTMRALYASGPLTWEQESLLTNLRLSLNISNEEHLLQLRRLLASS
uniref:ENT domain-containing protein n=1 Tax=Arundo donax TaxID=35708 RepID=A0A0A9DHR2_ARUDO